MILLLQTKKLKHMGVKNLVQGHTAEKCQCQGSSPDSLAPGSMLYSLEYSEATWDSP